MYQTQTGTGISALLENLPQPVKAIILLLFLWGMGSLAEGYPLGFGEPDRIVDTEALPIKGAREVRIEGDSVYYTEHYQRRLRRAIEVHKTSGEPLEQEILRYLGQAKAECDDESRSANDYEDWIVSAVLALRIQMFRDGNGAINHGDFIAAIKRFLCDVAPCARRHTEAVNALRDRFREITPEDVGALACD
jgi:hypothetical protein